MYILKAEQSFDSAHFLAGYNGKCSNIHGHRWRVEIEVQSETVGEDGQLEGMVVDFGDLKNELKEIVDGLDHGLIIQEGTMRADALRYLTPELLKIIEIEFRPTAENFAAYFYKIFKNKGHNVKRAIVYETPTNSASFEESENK